MANTFKQPEDEISRLQQPLEMFRARTQRRQIHPQEKLLLAILGTQLALLPWLLGGVHIWTHWVSLVLASLALAVALTPRNYTEAQSSQGSFRLVMWPKLMRFPVFWLGLIFLAYVTCQGLNPAWEFVRNERGAWWMQRIHHMEWLPSGVRAPIERGGEWRRLLVYLAVWLSVCALWIGITRRRSLQVLFTILAVNGVGLALFGLIQRLLGNGKIFWFYTSSNPSFFSSFIYKNHAGAFLNLTLILSCGIAGWYYFRGLRRLEKSNPAGIFMFFAVFIAMNVLISYSRGATMAMLLFLFTTLCIFLYWQFTGPSGLRRPIVVITMVVLFGFFLKTGMEALNTGLAWSHFTKAFSSEDVSAKARVTVTKASLDMLHDYWLKGSGAGSYVFLFASYQQHYPELWTTDGTRLLWEHAHNDIVEFPIELGLLGMLMPLGAAGYFAVKMIRCYFWRNPLGLCVVGGLLFMLSHAWFEFIFQCPSILLTSWIMLAGAAMFCEFEETSSRG